MGAKIEDDNSDDFFSEPESLVSDIPRLNLH